MKVLVVFAMLAGGVAAARGEVGCFRTVAQAALQVGEQEGGGYRLLFVRRDAAGGRNWAGVRSCLHPERPAVLVPAVLEPTILEPAGVPMGIAAGARPNFAGAAGVDEVRAGRAVRVVLNETLARIEMGGMVQGSGAVGERVRVRLNVGAGAAERFVEAVVRSADVVEVVR